MVRQPCSDWDSRCSPSSCRGSCSSWAVGLPEGSAIEEDAARVERLSPASRSRPVVWRPPLPSGALGGGPTATEPASSRRLSPDGGERHGSAFGGQIPPTAHCVFSQSQPIGPAAARLAAVL